MHYCLQGTIIGGSWIPIQPLVEDLYGVKFEWKKRYDKYFWHWQWKLDLVKDRYGLRGEWKHWYVKYFGYRSLDRTIIRLGDSSHAWCCETVESGIMVWNKMLLTWFMLPLVKDHFGLEAEWSVWGVWYFCCWKLNGDKSEGGEFDRNWIWGQ